MQIKCEIESIKTIKKGMKVILSIPLDQTKKTMRDIHNFMDKPVTVDLLIDSKEYQDRMKLISPEQRKKIYAMFKDISAYTGNIPESEKENMKIEFIQNSEYEDFSLSNCSNQLARDFIEFMIRFCFENGIQLIECPVKGFDDIEKYIQMTIKYKKCAVCGLTGEIHHIDTIGMGNNRKKVDDSNHRKICLCRKHHSEAHTMGWNDFTKIYHLEGA